MPKCKLLPLSKRPTMKRPQSCIVPSSPSSSLLTSLPYASSPPALLSSQACTKRTKTSSSTTTTTNSNKNQFPIWKGGSSISALPKTVLYHIVSSPMTHLLRNGNDLIEKGVTPNDICTWIVEYVVSISAMGQYTSGGSSKNEVSAFIQTTNNVVFSISLYQIEIITPNLNHKQHSSPCTSSPSSISVSNYQKKKINLLIDIERIRGDTIEFHWIVKSIFDMIHNRIRSCNNNDDERNGNCTNHNDNKTKSSLSSTATTIHPTSFSTTTTTTNEESNTKHFPNTMETIHTLLKKDRLDANLLGMESLDFLLNGYSSNDQVTYLASKAVLSSSSGGSDGILDDATATTAATCCQLSIRDEVLDVVNLHTDDDDEDDEAADEKKNPIMTHRRRMKHLAFKIFANALSTMMNSSRRSELEQIIQENIEEWKDIFTKFVGEMKKVFNKSDDNNNIGDLSILYEISRCVQILVSLNVQLNLLANQLDVCSVMLQFRQEDSNISTCNGLCAHRDLGKVSKSIVSSLNQCQ